MGLAFELHLPADKKFLLVGEIPALTAKAIHPESEEAQELCQINHKEVLDKAIKAGMVTPLNPLSYEQHTFPFGDALRRAVISFDDFKRFAETLQIEVVIWDEPLPTRDTDDVAGTKTHLTIREAASALAEKYGFNENTTNTMRTQLFEAAEKGDIAVRHPHHLLPYTPNPRRDFYELVSITDLNVWLEKQGVEYRLDSPEQVQYGDDAPESEHVKNADEIPGIIPKASSCRLAVMAALEIEYETGKRATAKQTMKRLQKWADEGKHGELIKSLPDNSVEWMTTKHEAKGFDLGACGKALERWNKSRQ